MIIELKAELERVANEIGAIFTSKSNSELQDFVQGFDFTNPLINLKPIENYNQNIIASGAIRYDFRFELFFLTKFAKSDHLEDTKDVLIDDMTQLSELFFTTLNKNENQYFINPAWKWTNGILRQYLSNLTCGVQASIFIDTSCNRVEDGFIPPSFPCPPDGELETWDDLVALIGRGYNYPQPTGQKTISYRTKDDADIEATVFAPVREANSSKAQNALVDFFTLVNNNELGNTDRLTDVDGLQVYGNNYMIDHYTGLGWFIDIVGTNSLNWNDAIDHSAGLTAAGFSDYFMSNSNQIISLLNADDFDELDYSPLNTVRLFWTSSTVTASSNAFLCRPTWNGGNTFAKGNINGGIFILSCRKHF